MALPSFTDRFDFLSNIEDELELKHPRGAIKYENCGKTAKGGERFTVTVTVKGAIVERRIGMRLTSNRTGRPYSMISRAPVGSNAFRRWQTPYVAPTLEDGDVAQAPPTKGFTEPLSSKWRAEQAKEMTDDLLDGLLDELKPEARGCRPDNLAPGKDEAYD